MTVAGLYDGQNMRQFVQGHNLQEFPRALAEFDLLVTFNGTQFDLPVLRAYFPELVLPPAHVDLRFLMARLGFKGGLKKIEPRFGIHRPKEVTGMDGYMAVLLWQRYQRGDKGALELAPHLQPGGRGQPGSAHGRGLPHGAGAAPGLAPPW